LLARPLAMFERWLKLREMHQKRRDKPLNDCCVNNHKSSKIKDTFFSIGLKFDTLEFRLYTYFLKKSSTIYAFYIYTGRSKSVYNILL
jgi:hypothetical protein